MKTIKEWFDGVEDEAMRALLLSNTSEFDLNRCEETLSDAIAEAFNWGNTTQGASFWFSIWDKSIIY